MHWNFQLTVNKVQHTLLPNYMINDPSKIWGVYMSGIFLHIEIWIQPSYSRNLVPFPSRMVFCSCRSHGNSLLSAPVEILAGSNLVTIQNQYCACISDGQAQADQKHTLGLLFYIQNDIMESKVLLHMLTKDMQIKRETIYPIAKKKLFP